MRHREGLALVTSAANHRWWHDGRGYRFAFCLFCGAEYMAVQEHDPSELAFPCPSPRAAGGEAEAQRILAEARRV